MNKSYMDKNANNKEEFLRINHSLNIKWSVKFFVVFLENLIYQTFLNQLTFRNHDL